MAYSKDTVRLKVHFRALNGQPITPDNVTLTIYDEFKEELEQFSLDENNQENVGVFYYDYVAPDGYDKVVFEFKGIYEGNPVLVRDTLKIRFN